MKNIIYFLPLFFFTCIQAQSFSSPESVDYDSLNSRWLVGQKGSGEIHVLNPSTGTLTSLVSGLSTGPHGIEAVGNTVYACDGGWIKGYDLTTGAEVFGVNLSATFLNGLTTDGGDYLFATDFSAKQIYRINVTDSSFNKMTLLALPKSPNGIYYDGPNNRLVFVSWGTSVLMQAMSLTDSSITTMFTTTLSNCDGVTRDTVGNWYTTAWSNNSLNMIPASLTGSSTVVKSGLSSPADIDINTAGDSIGIPNSGSANNVVFYTIPVPVSIQQNVIETNSIIAFPNPMIDYVNITLHEALLNGEGSVYDITGRKVYSQKLNGYAFRFDTGSLSSGEYIIKIRSSNGSEVAVSRVVKY